MTLPHLHIYILSKLPELSDFPNSLTHITRWTHVNAPFPSLPPSPPPLYPRKICGSNGKSILVKMRNASHGSFPMQTPSRAIVPRGLFLPSSLLKVLDQVGSVRLIFASLTNTTSGSKEPSNI